MNRARPIQAAEAEISFIVQIAQLVRVLGYDRTELVLRLFALLSRAAPLLRVMAFSG
jgi:hypothetical protein